MKNTLDDVSNTLIAQLERLGNEDLQGENLKTESQRAEAMASISENIINAAKVQLLAQKMVHNGIVDQHELPNSLQKKAK